MGEKNGRDREEKERGLASTPQGHLQLLGCNYAYG